MKKLNKPRFESPSKFCQKQRLYYLDGPIMIGSLIDMRHQCSDVTVLGHAVALYFLLIFCVLFILGLTLGCLALYFAFILTSSFLDIPNTKKIYNYLKYFVYYKECVYSPQRKIVVLFYSLILNFNKWVLFITFNLVKLRGGAVWFY